MLGCFQEASPLQDFVALHVCMALLSLSLSWKWSDLPTRVELEYAGLNYQREEPQKCCDEETQCVLSMGVVRLGQFQCRLRNARM